MRRKLIEKLGSSAAMNGFRRWCRDKSGIAAVEFAFVVPVLLVSYLGAIEIGQAIEVNKKVGRSASMVADLLTQESDVDVSQIRAIMDIGTLILEPYTRFDLAIGRHRHDDLDMQRIDRGDLEDRLPLRELAATQEGIDDDTVDRTCDGSKRQLRLGTYDIERRKLLIFLRGLVVAFRDLVFGFGIIDLLRRHEVLIEQLPRTPELSFRRLRPCLPGIDFGTQRRTRLGQVDRGPLDPRLQDGHNVAAFDDVAALHLDLRQHTFHRSTELDAAVRLYGATHAFRPDHVARPLAKQHDAAQRIGTTQVERRHHRNRPEKASICSSCSSLDNSRARISECRLSTLRCSRRKTNRPTLCAWRAPASRTSRRIHQPAWLTTRLSSSEA